ncbi:hypothetical protein BH23ACT12_BH23ACT12_09720 [soil metagenome]
MADQDMDQEIRENAGDRMQDNIENIEGTKKWGNLENNPDGEGGGADIPGSDSPEAQQAREEFPRVSEEEVIDSAEAAKASFGGTGGLGGGGAESDADPAIATGQKPGMGSDTSGQEASGDGPSRAEVDDAEPVEDFKEAVEDNEGMTTGQKFAGILSSDPNMKMESKIAEKMSGGDDKNTEGT